MTREVSLTLPRLGVTALQRLASFFFNDTATTEIYTLSLHDALPIFMLGNLLTTARTGKKAWASGVFWEYFAEHKEDGRVFNQAMTSFSASEISPVLESYDFSGIYKLMDVAGGYGSLLAAVLKAHPGMQGILFDAPPVIEGARAEIEAAGLADRKSVV